MQEGEETKKVRENLYTLFPDTVADDWNDFLLSEIDACFRDIDERNSILDGVVSRLIEMGCRQNDKIESYRWAIKELNKLYKEKGIGDGTPRYVRNWLEGNSVVNPAYRKNMYDLCIALDMDIIQTKTFFAKYYLEAPFNLKNREDAIFYFGIKNNLPYQTIKELLGEFENIEKEDGNIENTNEVGDILSQISDINLFREYMLKHVFSKRQQYNSAAENILKLLKKSAFYAEKERAINPELLRLDYKGDLSAENPIDRKDGSINVRGLLSVIYNIDLLDEESIIHISENLPKRFRINFPRQQELTRIKNRDASPDVYRKALIILQFYCFFAKILLESSKSADGLMRRDDETRRKDCYEFEMTTSALLTKCGFVQLYPRNPFDIVILYCAKSTDPLLAFRELLVVGRNEDAEI